ncbi:MAG: transglycosylase domain-containing protein [Pseudonocardiaceae bacterium]
MSDQRYDGGRHFLSAEPAIGHRPAGPAIKHRPGGDNPPPERFGHRRLPDWTAAAHVPPQDESELLTQPFPAVNDPGSTRRRAAGGDGPRWSTRLRRVRTIALVGLLLAILAPVLAFFAGWLFLAVPSPAELAGQRKQVTTIIAGDGVSEIGRYVPEEGNRIPVTLVQVPTHVQNAVLAAEDRSFRSNPGFDVAGIARATWKQLTGGSGGGSTITQQYVKVATGRDEYSVFRKFREVIAAAKITKQDSKDQILENYLNTIYFGRGAYGIQAASQAYFAKSVQDLTVSEAAVLAAAIRSPSRLDPAKNLEQARSRWSFVLDGMVEQGWLSPAQAAVRYPDTVAPSQAAGAPTDDRAHIVDRVLEEMEKHGIDRAQLAVNGGRITTTIDSRAQQLAREAVLTELRGQPNNLHSALVAIDPRSGGVVAYYGGSEGDGFDLAGGPVWNPGSAFKPFTMLAALERDIGMNTFYDGNSPLTIDGREFANSESRNYPQLSLREAMTQSVNTAFVRLAQDVGPQAVRDAAVRAGIPEQIDGKRALVEADSGAAAVGITLGQYPVHTIDMAGAYATFAAEGMRREPFFIREYASARGSVEYQHVDKAQPAFDRRNADRNTQLARNVTATLADVARSSQIPLAGGRQVAAKTGTHQRGETGDNSAAWTVGYTPSISTAVWVGDPANTAIKAAEGGDIFGKGLPGSIWQRFMDSYLLGTPLEIFPPFTLIGPAAPPAPKPAAPAPARKREPSRPTPSPKPESPIERLVPIPIEPAEDSNTPRRNSCFPFCDNSAPNDEE